MKITHVKTSDLIPYARNARTHSDQQIAQIAGSIRQFGFRNPVLIDGENGIIAGHGRVMAAQKLGLDSVPCVDCSDMSETDKRAYALADNRIALNSGWDDELLGLELADLSELEVDLEALGFDDKELNALLTEADGQDGEDETPELDEVNVISKPGDVWILGKHRLICGDCIDPEVAKMATNGVDVDIILTDPPYCSGGFQESGRVIGSVGTSAKVDGKGPTISRDNLTTAGLEALVQNAVRNVPSRGCCYVFADWRQFFTIRKAVEPCGYQFRAMLVWDKEYPGMGGPWRHQFELVYFGTRRKEPSTGKIGDLIRSSRTGNPLHPTQKPVELLRTILDNTAGDYVADPFSGSGSTLIACEQTGRTFFGSEIQPAYVDVCVRRWQEITGQVAALEATGEPFDAVSVRAA